MGETGGLDSANLFYRWVRICTERRGNRRHDVKITDGPAFSYIPELPDMRECNFAGPERDVVIREEMIELRVDGN